MLRKQFGETRSTFQDNHALISPDSFERTTLPNWPGIDIIFVITPQMGARFSMYLAEMPDSSIGQKPFSGLERFIFVLSGSITLQVGDHSHEINVEGYAFIPADQFHSIKANGETRIVVLEKVYSELENHSQPSVYVGDTKEVPMVPMKGDDRLMLSKLVPEELSFDCEINVMDFSPGASLPYVETHFMEHGLLFLDGGGVYRLDDCWYSVAEGDFIWMGPFCPQWFGAIGRTNTRYLIYKNWNRDPHE